MTITKLNAEEARTVGAALARALGYLRRFCDQIRAMARAALEAARRLAKAWRRSPAAAAAVAPSRPAWMSPYGPPAPRRCR